MAEGKTSMFGKTYNTIGSTDSNFIIKTKGDLKIQWGNKYIDVIKNGKIASEGSKLLFKVDTEEEIKDNGLYLVGEKEIWLNIDGTRVNISNESEGAACISYMIDQNLKTEEHHKALTNIGFYYPSLLEAQYANIVSGIIYAEKEHKLYIAYNGSLTEYNIIKTNDSSSNNKDISEDEEKEHPLYINGFYIRTDKTAYIECNSEAISLLTPIFVHNILLSNNADHTRGYRLYMDNEGYSALEIDYIKLRKYPLPIKYSELYNKIVNKLLSPKMYYSITDFQNPWEVTWDEEIKYYEDLYTEIKGELCLSGVRNTIKLIVQAKTEEELEEFAWYSKYPEWIIKYDIYYQGPKHVLAEDNIQYGFRSRLDENGDIVYLPCKGQITYLKDEFGNEANFNFRHFLFFRNNVWRYCIDLQTDSNAFFGEFKESKNNQFNIESLDSRIQVFKFEEIIDANDNILGYKPYAEDSDIIISKGHNVVILMPQPLKVEGNIFNLPKIENNLIHTIQGSNLLEFSKNTIINLKTLINIQYTSINNYFEDIEKTINIVEIPCKDNTFRKFKCDLYITGIIFEGNYLNDFIYNVNNLHTFRNNTIYKCSSYINNTFIFEENVFEEIVGNINNSGTFLKNSINKVQAINNTKLCINNNILEIELLINNDIFEDNNITTIGIINNLKEIIGNIITNSLNIYNEGLLNYNIIELSKNINNYKNFSDNSINTIYYDVNNYVIFCENNINELIDITISNSNYIFRKNKANIISGLKVNNNMINNTFGDINIMVVNYSMSDNIFKNINNITINGTFNENTFANIDNSYFNNTTENNVVSGDIKNSNFLVLISNNIFKNFERVKFLSNVEKCIFNQNVIDFTAHTLYVCIFDYIDNLSLNQDVYYTTFHGHIGNITRLLTALDWKLLSDESKKTDAYPNIKVICIPDSVFYKGMIIMWYGKEPIPNGWALCDGKNGTPNLINRFIKGGTVNEEINNEDLSKFPNNKLQIKQEHLPIHSHPHNEHTHKHNPHSHTHNRHRHSVDPAATSTLKAQLSGELNWTDYIYSVTPKVTKSTDTVVIPEVGTEGDFTNGTRNTFLTDVTVTLATLDLGGSVTIPDHSHTVDIASTNTSYTTTTELETTSTEEPQTSGEKELTEEEYPNNEINIEPHYYSLIFIMKIDN